MIAIDINYMTVGNVLVEKEGDMHGPEGMVLLDIIIIGTLLYI